MPHFWILKPDCFASIKRGDDLLVAYTEGAIDGSEVNRERDVARQCPGRRRPRKKIYIAAQSELFWILYFELYIHTRIFRIVLISLRDFVRRKRGAAARAPRNDFVIFVQKLFLVRRL